MAYGMDEEQGPRASVIIRAPGLFLLRDGGREMLMIGARVGCRYLDEPQAVLVSCLSVTSTTVTR